MSFFRGVLGLLVLMLALVWTGSALASTSGVVISQVYGGGGNSGATLKNDFIELYNAGSTAVSLSGWSVQYASSAGTSWQRTLLSGTIAPGGYYLVQEGAGAGGTVDLPAPDASGGIAMSASSGKVALSTSTTLLTGSCPTVEDFVGYGSANCFEGSGAAPGLSNTTADLRGGDGAIDTDNNSSDFAVGSPNPRNSSFGTDVPPTVASTSPADGATGVARNANLTVTFSEEVDLAEGAFTLSCTATGSHTLAVSGGPTAFTLDPSPDFASGETCTATVVASKVTDRDGTTDEMAGDHTWSFATVTPPVIRAIGEVQGSVTDADSGTLHRSPFAPPSGNSSGQTVAVEGVIYEKTLAGSNRGFFIQNTAAQADGDPTTSDGIFVFTGRFSSLIGGYVPQVGDNVVIQGRVSEFFNFTQLSSATLLEQTGSLLDLDVVLPAFETDPPNDLGDANRYWERREGMRALVPAGALVTDGLDVFASTADSEMWVMRADNPLADRADPYARRAFRDPHPLDNDPALFDDGNGYRILVGTFGLKGASNDASTLLSPSRTFDTVTNDLVGGIYFNFGKYAVMTVNQPSLTQGVDPSLNNPPTAPERIVEYSIGDYNVENLYDFRDDPFDGCDFAGNAGCPGVNPPFDYVPASDAVYQERLGLISEQIKGDLHAPDVILVQEAEDQDICSVAGGSLTCGAVDDADGKPDTLQELALRIAASGGPSYDAAYDRDGSDDRGIVAALLYRTDRVELLTPTADHSVLGSTPEVEYRVAGNAYNSDVQNPKSLNAPLPADVDRSSGVDGSEVYTRDPQVGWFRIWRNAVGYGAFVDVYAISNHFSSNPEGRRGQRREQAGYLAAIVEALGSERVVAGGDFNVFPRPDDPVPPSDQLGPLYDAGLWNVWETMVAENPSSAYSYVFVGQAQTLDGQFITPTLHDELGETRVAHVNADFPADFAGDGARGLSDHDPMASRFELAATIDGLEALLRYYNDAGEIRGDDTFAALLGHLNESRTVGDPKLRAFSKQALGKAPQFIDQDIADALAAEAQLVIARN